MKAQFTIDVTGKTTFSGKVSKPKANNVSAYAWNNNTSDTKNNRGNK